MAARDQYYVGILLHGGLFMSRLYYLYLGRSLCRPLDPLDFCALWFRAVEYRRVNTFGILSMPISFLVYTSICQREERQ